MECAQETQYAMKHKAFYLEGHKTNNPLYNP